MNKQQAKKIIKDTFERSFDRERFINFMRNLLNSIDESKVFHVHGYVKEAFKAVIKTYERIGTFSSPEGEKIDIIIAYLQKGYSLDHARTTQRNFAGRYLVDRGKKDAGLFAFVAPDEDDWRFSLVKMDYKFENTKTGQMKVKEEFTPARRWSFLVGANEKSHTAQSRLVNILANDEQTPTLKEIEEAFDIETVTKEFFSKYRDLFLRTKEELDRVVKNDPKIKADFYAKGVDTVNFAKKLLGQIIFLYFLQKKGWFGVGRNNNWGTGSKQFLRELFNKKHGGYNNFFDDILEPLFYEALRRDRSDDDGYYSQFDCKIPFLNGGLFDPIGNYDWVNTNITIPNELFSNTMNTKEDDTGDGILDIFDRYNFTVKEDEPMEQEVAIDPELLGKAYEKFNAIRPDNYDEFKKALKSGKKSEENKFNKTFGVYYTPREIVHYMCRQSLINYLHTEVIASKAKQSLIPSKEDIETLIYTGEHVSENEVTALIKGQNIKEGKQKTSDYKLKLPESIRSNAALIDRKLADITVCDPAVGSGAFPVGMMSEIVKARNVLSIFINDSNRTAYEFKRRSIEHSLYGVDIDPGAVEIAKLRLWLSLIVDEDNIKNIKPLPNLDYRIMQGNSLISGIDLNAASELFKDEAGKAIERLQQKQDDFLSESNTVKKLELKEEIDNLQINILTIELKNKKLNYFKKIKVIEEKYSILPRKEQRDKLIKQDKEKLYKILRFDPEYEAKQSEECTSGKKIKHFFMWQLNFSEIFYAKTDSKHSQMYGFDVVIANPPYIQLQKMADNTRHYADLYDNKGYETFERTGDIYALFYEKGMKLLKDKGLLCYITSNKWMRTKYGISLRRFFSKKNPLKLIDLGPDVFDTATVDTAILLVKNSKPNKIKLQALTLTGKEPIEQLTDKSFTILTDLSEGSWIILSPEEQKLKQKIERIGKPLKEWDVEIYYGVKTGLNEAFIVDTPTKERLCKEDSKSAEILKPILRGRDIKRYSCEWAGLWLLATGLDIDIPKLYPAVFKHLLQFEDRAKKRGDQGLNWWNLRACAYYEEFEKDKVMYQEIVRKPQFYYDENKYYPANTTFILTGKNTKYLISLLNSNPIAYFFKTFYAGGELGKNGVRYLKAFLIKLPIPKTLASQQKPFEELLNKIIAGKEKGADTSPEEREIDQLVYKLYDLTPDEIAIIESEKK
ncbi:Eco57I restriction-modification methylase domain-containing protein [Candidatus Acidulodesulfobacterium sp. H_13]|uniref:Eco57I restriction-modification methylase domain-containing protein n=1 Tax=Candidatus Acidulodesulfobacterium sp. H_13 TaxID=3395470 RepID=UPI003AF46A18